MLYEILVIYTFLHNPYLHEDSNIQKLFFQVRKGKECKRFMKVGCMHGIDPIFIIDRN